MKAPVWDTIIVGQGLAGTALGWALHLAGQRVLLLGDGDPASCSRIAAGLVTPITGRRMVLSSRCMEALPVAHRFYERIEALAGQKFFHQRTAIRLFKTDRERQIWSKRGIQPSILPHLLAPQPDPLLPERIARDLCGGFAMKAAQLDIAAYLDASSAILPCETMSVNWRNHVAFTDSGVAVAGYYAKRVISCEGYTASENPYFAQIGFKAAKGEILTVRFAEEMPRQTIHGGIWIAPTREAGIYRVGATYDWHRLDNMPTDSARETIKGKLRELICLPFEILDHNAAIRPIINESRALIGLHPDNDRLGYFNGLGSKGSLYSPFYAERFAEFLVHGKPIPAEMDVQKVQDLQCV